MNRDKELLESLRSGIDVLVRVLKITDAAQLPDGKPPLTPSETQTLAFLAAHQGCIATEIARFLNVSATTVSSIVDRLVRRGLVKRERTEENRRVVLLFTTDEGNEAAAAIINEQLNHCEKMLNALAPPDQKIFVDYITTIAENLLSKP